MQIETLNIVLVLYQYSVVAKGIENKLKSMGYHVDIVSEKFELIRELSKTSKLFIVYLPGDIRGDKLKMKTFSNISEMIVEGGRDMIIIGDLQQQEDLNAGIPSIMGSRWIDRPVEMEKLSEAVDEIMRVDEKENYKAKKRILIVDDDPSYAKMVREWIKEVYRVDIVTAGMQAISFLLKVKESEKVDLILLDYEMPVVDGPQVLQMLRQDPDTKGIPVIFLTGQGSKEAVARVMELKPDGYILKSTTREDLMRYLYAKLN
ncbi:MAG: response regulator [Lachnospiraceae bacterium]|nr:response regulator [Lachnospiraceae bacterium]